jgi:hypothetical protein
MNEPRTPYRLVFRKHAERRRRENAASVADVARVLREGEILRTYPEDRPYESRLVLGWIAGDALHDDAPSPEAAQDDAGRRPLHVVAADAHELNVTFVITVYEPDPALWSDDFRTRTDR